MRFAKPELDGDTKNAEIPERKKSRNFEIANPPDLEIVNSS